MLILGSYTGKKSKTFKNSQPYTFIQAYTVIQALREGTCPISIAGDRGPLLDITTRILKTSENALNKFPKTMGLRGHSLPFAGEGPL